MQRMVRGGAPALWLAGLICLGTAPAAAQVAGEGPALARPRVEQADIESGRLRFEHLRQAGLVLFATPFNRLDGFGDGPMDPADTVSPGGRPTLQGNGMFLRVNGLDAQNCLECHSLISNATVPPLMGIGGAGGSNSNAIIKPTAMDPADLDDLDSNAGFNGRFANPPFIFGAGGVQLLALEMTRDLQELRAQALAAPGAPVALESKGVSFGTLVADGLGRLDTSAVEGVDADLVVRPFGRKGEFATTREFDVGAMQFHMGMQPTEVVGRDVDADQDGVVNEILTGELSALEVFVNSMPVPVMAPLSRAARQGLARFEVVGCAGCHVPVLSTQSRRLPLRFPEVPTDMEANVFIRLDLARQPAGFARDRKGGLLVPLFADLKRHDMGPGLAEEFALADADMNREFTTARLWGVADTGPWLHDGRATTLTDAILLHGGEAQAARDGFAALEARERSQILALLRSLRTPGTLEALQDEDDESDDDESD